MEQWQWLIDTIRDLALNGLAVFIIIRQVYSARPSDILLATALALTGTTVGLRARNLIGHGTGHGSESHQAQRPPRLSSSQEEAPDEAR